MDDHRKTKKQLIAELVHSRERIAQLEQAEAECKQVEESRAIAGQDEKGLSVALQGSTGDTSERKKSETDLKDSRNRLVAIFNNTTDYQLLVELESDNTFRIVAVNQAYVDRINQFGIPVEASDLVDITFKELDSILHLDDEAAADVVNNYIRVAETKEKLEFIEDLIINENAYYAEISLIPILDSQGNCQYILYNSHDITTIKRSEELLKESEDKFRNLYSNSPFGIIICEMLDDENGNFVDFIHLEANQSTEKNTGFDSNEFSGTKASEMVDQRTLKELVERYGNVVLSGKSVNYEQYFEIYDRTLEVTAFPLYGNMFIINLINITERRKAERLLQENNRRHAAMIENIGDVIGIIDVEGMTIYQSPNMERWFGWKPEDLIGANGWDKMHPDDIERIQKEFVKMLGNETPSTVEYRFRCKDGTYKWIELTAVDRLNDPAINGVLINYHDITERKQAEITQGEMRERLNFAMDIANEGFWEWNLSTNTITFDELGLKMLGYTPDFQSEDAEFWLNKIHPDQKDDILQAFDDYLSGKKSAYNVDFPIQRKDGSYIWVASIAKVFKFDPDGKPLLVVGIHQDISERKRAEQQLVESEERLRLALKSANQGLYDLNIQTGDAVVSPEYASMLGYDPETFVETNQKWVDRLHPHDLEKTSNAYKEYIEGKSEEYNVEFRQKTQSGNWIWILSMGSIVENDAQGNPLRMLGTHTDITRRKQAEDQLKLTLADKEILLQELYHRTKNNMQTIIGLIDLQALQSRNEQIEALLKDIRNRVRSMALVHQKLYQSQNLSSIDLGDYIQELTALLMSSYQVASDRISLVFELEPVSVLIDTAIPCGLILNELVSNVLKHAFPHNEPGELRIVLKKSAAGEILLQVADDGVGLPSGFDPSKSDNVGLQTVFGIAEYQLRGKITCESAKGVTWQLQFSDTLYQPRV